MPILLMGTLDGIYVNAVNNLLIQENRIDIMDGMRRLKALAPTCSITICTCSVI